MSKTVHCVRIANVLHRGSTFWEHDAWVPFQDRVPEWTAAPTQEVQEVDRDFVPFREKKPDLGSDGRQLRLEVPFATSIGRGDPLFDVWYDRLSPIERGDLDKIGGRNPDEPVIVFNPVLAESAHDKQIGRTAGQPLASPLIARLLPKFLDADHDNPRRVVFNKSLDYVRAVLMLTANERFAWEWHRLGDSWAEIERQASRSGLTPAERSEFVARSRELGIELGKTVKPVTVFRSLERKLADAREHFSGSRELRSMGPRYRAEFMLGLSAYRATTPARTAAFSNRGYTIQQCAPRTEIATDDAPARQPPDWLSPAARFSLWLSAYTAQRPRGLYEPVIVFAESWSEPRDFRLVFRSVVDLDELFPPLDQDPGLLLRMLTEPDCMRAYF